MPRRGVDRIAMRGVVVHAKRHIREHDGLEVERRDHLVEAGQPSVVSEGPRIGLRKKTLLKNPRKEILRQVLGLLA